MSGRATSGEPKNDGRAFGESVSDEAKGHAPALPPQAQNAPETGEALSEQRRQTGDNASGGRVP